MSLHSLIDHPDKLLEFIHASLKPKDVEKKQFGEVFTPMPLVQEMLDKLPSHVWSNPALTWFDPAVGMGNFMIAVYLRLMDGLKDALPDPKERKRHILEKMLFMSELNQKNVFVCKQIFDVNGEYKTNIYQGDTLKLDIRKEWGVEGFDVVVGNPPYNAPGKGASGNTIWQNFTKTSIQKWLACNGYLLFIHPPGWRKPNTTKGKFTGLFKMMTKENQMLYLEIHDSKDGQKTFHCGTRYDWYLIEKQTPYKPTMVVDEEGNHLDVEMSRFSWFPNANMVEIQKIQASEQDEPCPIIQSMSAYEPRKNWMSTTKDDIFKYPCVNSTPKSGVRYMYSRVNDKGHFGIPKVIFGDSGISKTIVDFEGKYGMTQHSMAIQVESMEEARGISKALESSAFKRIIQSCLFSSYAIDWNIFKHFKRDFWKEFV